MPQRFDLAEMLKEIELDQAANRAPQEHLPQSEIRRLFAEVRRRRAEARRGSAPKISGEPG